MKLDRQMGHPSHTDSDQSWTWWSQVMRTYGPLTFDIPLLEGSKV